jgi:CrcB protein
MVKNLLLVALGGAVGSVGRYLLSKWLEGGLPWGTLAVNIVGCLLIGFLTGLFAKGTLPPEMKLLLVTGFCGGFTTFSTFANESFAMMKVGDAVLAAIYIGASVAAGILAVYVGLQLTK